MRISVPRRPVTLRVLLVAVLATALAWNGAATILAAAMAPTIRACVKQSGPDKGLMRYAPGSTRCATGETALTWNVTGATGPQGPAGPSGGGGAASYWKSTWGPDTIQTGTATMKFTLPKGDYLVSFNAYFEPDHAFISDVLQVRCKLTLPEGPTTYSQAIYGDWAATLNDSQFISLSGQGVAQLDCSWSRPADASPQATMWIDAILYATPADLQ